MGIGEDEELGDTISVTIVATGFAADQQSNITNTEVKKIVHTLEDEQKATYNFEEKVISKSPTLDVKTEVANQKIVHVLEDDIEEEKPSPKLDLIPTTELIANIPVTYEEIFLETVAEDDFIITDLTVVFFKAIKPFLADFPSTK